MKNVYSEEDIILMNAAMWTMMFCVIAYMAYTVYA